MKKSCNKLLIISIIISILIMFNCIIMIQLPNPSITETSIGKIQEMNGAPGSGELLMITLPISILADFGTFFAILIFNIMIPGITLFNIIIFQTAARLFQLGEERKWKNIVSFILTVISVLMAASLLFTLCLCIGLLKYLSLVLTVVMISLFAVELFKMAKRISNI